MKKIWSLTGLAMTFSVQARDLSNGVVFPSSNSAVIQNPAALGRLKGAAFDGGVFVDGGYQGGLISYVGNASGGLGLGIDARRVNLYRVYDLYDSYFSTGGAVSSQSSTTAWSNQVTASLGFKATSFFTFGLGFNFYPGATNGGLNINAGTQIVLSDKVGLALVAYDIENILAHWSAGLGVDLVDGMVTGEIDADFYGPAKSFSPTYVGVTPGLVFGTKKVSLKLAYRAEMHPSTYFPTNSPTLGLAFQFAPGMALYASYNDIPTTYVVGLKFRQ